MFVPQEEEVSAGKTSFHFGKERPVVQQEPYWNHKSSQEVPASLILGARRPTWKRSLTGRLFKKTVLDKTQSLASPQQYLRASVFAPQPAPRCREM